MKKSIYIMINSLGVGGAEKSLISLLNLIDYNSYNIYLQILHRGGDFEIHVPSEVCLLDSIEYFEFCEKSLKRQLISGKFGFLITRFKTMKSIRENNKTGHKLHDSQAYWRGASTVFPKSKEKYDIAIAWGQGTPTHYIAEKINATQKIAWINADYEAVGHNKSFDEEIYSSYQRIVCVSDALAKKMKTVFPTLKECMSVVYDINSVSLIEKMSNEPVELPHLHGTILVTVGRLVKPKGYDLAIEAATELKNRNIDFTWLVIGDGIEKPILEELIRDRDLEENLVLLGRKANPYPYLKVCDIYVQTSRNEGFCMALTEARILTCPCVSTDFDAVYDQLINGENGIIVKKHGVDIANGIEELICNRNLYMHILQYQKNEKNSNEDEIEKVYQLFNNTK